MAAAPSANDSDRIDDTTLAAAGTGLDTFDRNTLIDRQGRTFREVRRGLDPRLSQVWMHLLAGYAVLAGTTIALFIAQDHVGLAAFGLVPLGAVVIGYAVAYIQLFFHEAAHYNIAKSRKLNDLLANLLIGSLVGQDIRAYRPIHFDHHRFLGTAKDTERSYFDALTWRFIFESLTGIRVLRVLSSRQSAVKAEPAAGATKKRSLFNAQLLFGLAIHGALLGAAAIGRHWMFALAWLAGMGAVFPFFAAVRQVIEHRSFDARANVDYSSTPHGAIHRTFGSGPLASTLGGAGFSRHLLHHWDPQLSYTRFGELEAYLIGTQAAPVLRAHRHTYRQVFSRLMSGR